MTRDVFLFWPVIFREDIEKVKGTNLENGRKRLLEKLIKRIKNVFFFDQINIEFFNSSMDILYFAKICLKIKFRLNTKWGT